MKPSKPGHLRSCVPHLVCALSVMLLASGTSRLESVQARPPSPAFVRLLDEYRHGSADAAVAEFATWSAKRIETEAHLPTSADTKTLAALALLHTEAGTRTRVFGRLVGKGLVVDECEANALKNDGILSSTRLPTQPVRRKAQTPYRRPGDPPCPPVGRGELLALLNQFEAHSQSATRLVEQVLRRARAASDRDLLGFCHSWYIVAVSYAGMNRALLLRLAIDSFLDDPEILLLTASTLDPVPGTDAAEYAAAMETRRIDVEPVFRRALELNPALVEARVRLGYLLYLNGNVSDAERELERAYADARTAEHRVAAYVASMFLGRMCSEQGRTQFGIQHYRDAVAAYPNAQVGHLALGQALVAAGRVDEGWIAARRVFGAESDPRNPDIDPLHTFALAQHWQFASRIRAMRERVR